MTSQVPTIPGPPDQSSNPDNLIQENAFNAKGFIESHPFRDGRGKFVKGHKIVGRGKGVPNKVGTEVRIWSRLLLESTTYRRALTKRIIAGTAPQIEVLLYHYAYGKPKETVELQASESMAGLLTLALGGAMLGALSSGASEGILDASRPILDVTPEPRDLYGGEVAPEPQDPVPPTPEPHDPPGSSEPGTT
jgi:hypothetical protein